MSNNKNNDKIPAMLKNMFTQEAGDLFSAQTETKNPALTAASTFDMLSKLSLGFLIPYLQKDGSRIFHKTGTGTHFFYNYDCPDTHSKAEEILNRDDEDDTDDLDPGLDRIDVAETLTLDLTTPDVAVGMDIVFNEDTGLYQLDAAYLKPADDELITVSCEQDDSLTLHRLITELCPLVRKIVNDQELDIGDLAALWPFQVRAALPGTGKPRPSAL